MKKINLFFVFVLFFALLSACKKDDEKEPTAKENLVGKTWVITEVDSDISSTFGTLPPELTNDFNPTEGLEGQTIIFNENGTFLVGEDDNQQQGNWTLSENGQTLTFSGLAEGDLTEFVDAQTLANLQTFEVTTLNNSKLAIQNNTNVALPEEITEQITGFPIPITLIVKLNITFDKQ
ncbi:hypothetical protein V9L05_09900 [Bernardetia sp. Wsw4-3y2]|uniref:hypothetical protein n=1 Tax=unclassified Bernardetia TaxID=2647129 RepID=UPI0030D387C7